MNAADCNILCLFSYMKKMISMHDEAIKALDMGGSD